MAKTEAVAQPETLAPRYLGPWVRFVVPALLGIVADLWVKGYSFPGGVDLTRSDNGLNPATAFDGKPWVVIPNVLGFTTTVNRGAVFGTGQGMGWLFIIFSFVALAAILWVFLRSRREQIWLQLALGLITAGAIGNLYDRLMFGGVRDMLKFYVSWYAYVFNVADVLLCIGVPLLMLCWLFQKDTPPNAEKAGYPAGPKRTATS